MSETSHLVLFTLENQTFAIPLDAVERIARVAEITPLPNAPENILGVINIQGKILPVVNLRKRFHYPDLELDPENHFIIAQTDKRKLALLVDGVNDIVESRKDKIVREKDILPHMDCIEGVLKVDDDIVLIHDLARCLSIHEEKQLDKALKAV